jgi:DNA-binding transcriptional regulator PaaX
MGKIEEKVRKRIRIGKIEKTALGLLFGAGLVSMAVFAPNAIQILKPFVKTLKGKDGKSYFSRVMGRLQKKGLVKIKNENNKTFVELTKEGEIQVLLIKSGELKIKKPTRWDKKWRLVIFDIKERQRRKRDMMRLALENIGFVKLQNSVWVYPYSAEDFISLLKTDFQIGKDLLYIVADEIENDKWLKSKFDLN